MDKVQNPLYIVSSFKHIIPVISIIMADYGERKTLSDRQISIFRNDKNLLLFFDLLKCASFLCPQRNRFFGFQNILPCFTTSPVLFGCPSTVEAHIPYLFQ